MGILDNLFMQRAFAAGIMIAVITPLIGTVSVTKRLSMIGEALSHTSLAGVAAGLLLNINPVLGAAVFCVFAALCIDAVRKKIPRYSELSIAIIMSAGLGTAALLSSYVQTPRSFNSFLFGSILLISRDEMIITAVISVIVILSFIFFYKEFFYIAFDERAARLSGVKAGLMNLFFTLLTAITVSAAARIAGALLVSSLMVIPAACGLLLQKSYKKTLIFSVLFAVGFTVTGLVMSFYIKGLKASAAIVLLGIICFVIILLISRSAQVKRIKKAPR
jgi:zinc transport system permease protein